MADLEAGSDQPSSAVEIERVQGFEDDDTVLFVSVPAASRGRGVDNVIVSLQGDALHNQLTVLAVHPWRRDMLDGDAMNDIARRVSGAPIYVLDHDVNGEPALRHVRGKAVEELDEATLIDNLRRAEVMAVLTGPGAHLPATDQLHYVGPNGHHYGAFLRPGFALTSNHRLDRISFWLMPYVRGRSNIVVDHWSMLALAHHATAYAARCFGEKHEVFVEALRGYESRESLGSRLRRALPATTDKALFLLSINSTGGLAHDVVMPALVKARQRGASVVALAEACDEDGKTVAALASLDVTFKRQTAADCKHCAKSKLTMPINRDTYLMNTSAYTKTTAIRKVDADDSTEVISAYATSGAFSLHRDYKEEGEERHHAFFVDVQPMLDEPRFKDRLHAAVESLKNVNASVIVCPPSRSACDLASRVSKLLGIDPEQVIETNERGLRALDKNDRDRLCEASDILLVDDVVITGRRIKAFRQELIGLKREGGFEGSFNFGCLVGVARPRDAHALRGLSDHVHHRSGVHQSFAAVETLFLPHWDQHTCPWCTELRLLREFEAAGGDVDLVRRRTALLEAEDGLEEPFFLLTNTRDAPGVGVGATQELSAQASSVAPLNEDEWAVLSESNKATIQYAEDYWTLNKGSVFGDVQGVNLMVSVAAAVQGLRSEVDKAGKPCESRLDTRFRSPVAKILHPDLYMFGRFYEPVLLAAILRACNSWDLRTPDLDDQLDVGVREHLEYLSSGRGLLAEAVIHAAAGRIPTQPVREIAEKSEDLRSLAQAVL